jgi:Ni,Fe-hydrogenase III large subunit
MTILHQGRLDIDPDALGEAVAARGRFCGLVASPEAGGTTRLRALIASGGRLEVIGARLAAGRDRYRSLTPLVPAAFWYEREVHDLFGLVPVGHPRLDPLVFPVADGPAGCPRPGRPGGSERLDVDPSSLPGHVHGEGVFTIPYGPVRSGVFETVEYLVETFGEDIPQVRVRPYLKHRGVSRRFAGLDQSDGVLLAERVEGAMSVAHASAFCQALEALAEVEPPVGAQLQRALHAELERVANHLDSMIRHTEGAGQAVAYARLTVHREGVLRLQAALCGHRFGRGVVVPGGTTGPPLIPAAEALKQLGDIEGRLTHDLRALMTTPSFLDRLRTTGVLSPEIAAAHGARGPVGRASATGDDVRGLRPYGAYPLLDATPVETRPAGDALARQWVRVDEIAESWRLARRALDRLGRLDGGPWRVSLPPVDGSTVGWVESPQGDLIYLLDVKGGRLVNVKACTASFHNFALFSQSFGGDILTDFVFIEASFGVNLAGVAG